ncbi:DUF1810 domain-containing protein [Kineosporia sp. J2-2]|uniref:DUF1810 domain-containing protein n=1 Tax=Kineosporia corallincola TaxID=2835133 RepID=A0ABS5TNS9_9ACTN|nr:DUF1810 domain-containing protein [Kineosporia corallincola]MBT0772757.1 DUF1810 domain-containing protein [Kineosporia corallincola]
MSDDPFDLARFVEAQDSGGTYDQAVRELRAGAKTSHWMWFVFPQVAGLGLSPTSVRYAISGLPEARTYLAHPVLGPRLVECATILLGLSGRTATGVLGEIDAAKLRSSMTLFAYADPEQETFRAVLSKFFDGEEDDATTARLGEVTPEGEEED